MKSLHSYESLYGLVGCPLEHSFSMDYFNHKFTGEGIDARYVNFEIDDVNHLLEIVGQYPNLRGLNVTTPYKEQVIPFLTAMHASAQAVGAVNVIKILRDHDGEVIGLEGHNTDARAFGMTIEPMLTPQRRSALVMGTGGAAKAVATALAALNVEVSFVSRRKNASTIAYEEITRAMVASHGIIVNATPVGMYPHVEQCPDFPCRLLTPHHLCYDLIYNPGETTFLKQARQAGAETKNGLEMLLLQAFLSYEVWTGNGGTSAAQ